MPIASGDVTKLRGQRHTIEQVLNVVPPVVVGSAQINQATFAYPLAQLTIDNLSVGWEDNFLPGRMIWIGTTPGAHDVLIGVIRKVSGIGTTLYIDAKSLGDPGLARQIINGLADNQYLTVLSYRPLWGLLSRIHNKIFYKAFDKAYTDQGSNPTPVCNIGPWQQAFVEPATGRATFTLSAAGSFAWGAKTISSYLWRIGSLTLVSGSLASSSITVSAPAGFHVVGCDVTDSSGKIHEAFTYLWANEKTGANAPIGYRYPYVINSDEQTRQGREMSVTFYGNVPESDIFPGTAFLYTEIARFDGQPVSDGVLVDRFVGYLSDESVTRTRTTPSLTVTIKSPFGLLEAIPCAPQVLLEKSVATKWTECTSILSHPDGAVWYTLEHHCPAMLQLHDYSPTGDRAPRKQSFQLQSESIAGQLQNITQLIMGNIGCASDGTLLLRRNPLFENNTFRNTLDSRFQWEAGDIIPPVEVPFNFRMPIGQVYGYAFSYAGGSTATPYASVAPGKSQGQGIGKPTMPTVIVAQSGAQDRLNEMTGHYYARENNPTPAIRLTADRNLDIVDPAKMVWHTLQIPATYDPRGVGWMGKRALPTRVSRTWRKTGRQFVKTIQIEAEPETFGQPGVMVPVQRGGANNWLWEGINIQIPVDFEYQERFGLLLPWNADAKLARTFNAVLASPTFENLSAYVTGNINDVTFDWGSTYFDPASDRAELGAWLVTTSGTTLRVYYVHDLFAPIPSIDEQMSTTMADSTTTTSARIVSSRTSTNFLIVGWHDRTGVRVRRSTDGGIGWAAVLRVGDAITDVAGNDNLDIGLDVDGVVQLITAPDVSGNYFLYVATATGGAFSKVTNSKSSPKPLPMVIMDKDPVSPSAYVAGHVTEGATTEVEVTFDEGGYAYCIVEGAGTLVGGGRPGNCLEAGGTVPKPVDLTVFIAIGIDIGTPVTQAAISFDWKADWTGTPYPLDGQEKIELRANFLGEPICSGILGGLLETHELYQSASLKNVWQTKTAILTTGVAYQGIRVNLVMDTNGSGVDSINIKLDNVIIEFTTGSNVDHLYRVVAYTGAAAWSDITPSGSRIPIWPYGLTVDRADSNRLMVAARSGADRRLYESADKGKSWTDKGVTSYIGLKRSGNLIVGFGDDKLDLSDDSGLTYKDKRGDLAVILGSIGTIRGVLATL